MRPGVARAPVTASNGHAHSGQPRIPFASGEVVHAAQRGIAKEKLQRARHSIPIAYRSAYFARCGEIRRWSCSRIQKMPESTSDGVDPDGAPRGVFYVGARVAGASDVGPSAVTRPCVHCAQDVSVAADDVALADSCAAVACSHCTSTAEGILYIAP